MLRLVALGPHIVRANTAVDGSSYHAGCPAGLGPAEAAETKTETEKDSHQLMSIANGATHVTLLHKAGNLQPVQGALPLDPLLAC